MIVNNWVRTKILFCWEEVDEWCIKHSNNRRYIPSHAKDALKFFDQACFQSCIEEVRGMHVDGVGNIFNFLKSTISSGYTRNLVDEYAEVHLSTIAR